MRHLFVLTILALPYLTLSQSRSKPERNFEKFWGDFGKYYAHFESRKVDWYEQYRIYRPRVSQYTSEAELLLILQQMVEPLRDGHVSISPTGDLPASAKYSSFHKHFPTKTLVKELENVSFETLRRNGFKKFRKFESSQYRIGGYSSSARYGYLQMTGFGGVPFEEFKSHLDSMVLVFSDKEAIIIDIRCNGGGYPQYVSEVFGRFIDKKRVVGYGQKKKTKGKTTYTREQKWTLQPTGNTQLVKPIILITNGATISAADHFAMYMNELPYVKIVGENTNGIFSSMMGRKMPNGWEYSLSNEKNISARKICYEGVGVPVDVKVENTITDLQTRQDPVIIKALEEIESSFEDLLSKTISYEEIAFNYLQDSIMAVEELSSVSMDGLVEGQITFIHPFAYAKCEYFMINNSSGALKDRVEDEVNGDSLFYSHSVKGEFYLNLKRTSARAPIFSKKKQSSHMRIYQEVVIDGRHYIRIDIASGWAGKSYLIIMNDGGVVLNVSKIEYQGVNYNKVI